MNPHLILASSSPRRKSLIEQIGLRVDVRPTGIEESFSSLPPVEDAVKIAEEKLREAVGAYEAGRLGIAGREDPVWILAADTIVAVDEEKLGKPVSAENAREILALLQGRTHEVITGLAMYSRKACISTASAVTEVSFSPLSEKEIEWYLHTEEWKGVAAGYRIQGAAARFIPSINGSYSNVMGLPIHTFYGMLMAHEFPFFDF